MPFKQEYYPVRRQPMQEIGRPTEEARRPTGSAFVSHNFTMSRPWCPVIPDGPAVIRTFARVAGAAPRALALHK